MSRSVPALIAASSFAFSTAAHSQQAEERTTASGGLQEVLVTAQKREESLLQDTPISIAALDAQAIESRGITTLLTVGEGVPNLQVSRG